MHFEVLIPWLLIAFISGPASMYWAWRGRAIRYEETLRIARSLITMDSADLARLHIEQALERR